MRAGARAHLVLRRALVKLVEKSCEEGLVRATNHTSRILLKADIEAIAPI
jgi:hypothetical protein